MPCLALCWHTAGCCSCIITARPQHRTLPAPGIVIHKLHLHTPIRALYLQLQLGTYDPIPMKKDGMKEVRLKVDRVKYWLGVGAQPSDSVAHLLWKAGLVPAPPIRFQPIKSVPKAERE